MLIATGMSIFMWAIATVFYMLRKLSKAKFDIENKSFELDSGEDEESTPPDINPEDLTNN